MAIFFRRLVLFLVLNALIIFTLSTILRVFEVHTFLTYRGIDYQSLLIFAVVWGMGGAFISLLLSRKIAKWTMRVKLIEPNDLSQTNSFLYSIVEKQSQMLGIQVPEIGIFDSATPNAFATGPSSSHALVAISTGLLNQMNRDEIEAVIGHEMSHIANGDMVTMTLLQGVVNSFVIFLSRALAYALASSMKSKDNKGFSNGTYFIISMVLELTLMLLGSLLICAYSRRREYKADAGSANLVGKEPMIRALQTLERLSPSSISQSEKPSEALQALMIHRRNFSLFSTHPSIERRIEHLEKFSN